MKTLGLLEADELYPDLVADYRSYGHMFETFLGRLRSGEELEFRYYQIRQGEFPQQGDCDAYLITGSKDGVYEDHEWIQPLGDWIRRAYQNGEKMIGICFGHQMLAHSLGGHAGRCDKGWGIGVRTSQIEYLPDWFSLPANQFRLLYSHRDQVNTLPPKAERLGSCPFCPNAAYSIGQQVLSFQGHPEFTAEYIQRLLPRRENCIGSDVFERGMSTLSIPTDENLIGQWMLDLIDS